MTPTRACWPQGMEHKGGPERGQIIGELSPVPPSVHSFQVFLDLTSSEIFTDRTWFAMVRTRPLEMSFSTVSWGRGEGGLRLGMSHRFWGHTQSCPGDSQTPPWSLDSPLCYNSPDGRGEEKEPLGRPEPTDKPLNSPASDASWPLSGRGTSHLAVTIDVVPHQLLQFGETLAEERVLAAGGPVGEVGALVPPYSQSLLSA